MVSQEVGNRTEGTILQNNGSKSHFFRVREIVSKNSLEGTFRGRPTEPFQHIHCDQTRPTPAYAVIVEQEGLANQ